MFGCIWRINQSYISALCRLLLFSIMPNIMRINLISIFKIESRLHDFPCEANFSQPMRARLRSYVFNAHSFSISRPGKRFQIYIDRGCPRLQLTCSSSAPRARRYRKEKVLARLVFGTSCNMTKQAEPSLHDQRRYTWRRRSSTNGTQSQRLTRRMLRMLSRFHCAV